MKRKQLTVKGLLIYVVLLCGIALSGCSSEKEGGSCILVLDTSETSSYVVSARSLGIENLYDISENNEGFVISAAKPQSGIYCFDGSWLSDLLPSHTGEVPTVFQYKDDLLWLEDNLDGFMLSRDGVPQHMITSGNLDPWINALQLTATDDHVWLCDGTRLYCDGKSVSLPQGAADGTFWRASAVTQIGDDLFVFLSKYRRSGEDAVYLGTWLCPLPENRGPEAEQGAKLPDGIGVPEPLCAVQDGYFYSGGVLYQTDDTSVRTVADLSRHGIDRSLLRRILVAENGEILCLQRDQLLVLSMSSEVVEKQTIRVGITFAWAFEEAAAYFNRSSEQYTLDVKEYANADQLNRAILTGEVDVLAVDDLSLLQNYAGKDILAPLDLVCPELFASNDLYETMLEGLRCKGKAYYLPLLVQPSVNVLPRSYSWTQQDLQSARAFFDMLSGNEPEQFERDTKEICFGRWLSVSSDYWLDRDESKANYQSDDFVALLEYCNRFAATQEEAMAHADSGEAPIAWPNKQISSLEDWYRTWKQYEVVRAPFENAAVTLFSPLYIAVVDGNAGHSGAAALLQTFFTDESWHQRYRASDMWHDSYSINRTWTQEDIQTACDTILDDPMTGVDSPEDFRTASGELEALLAGPSHFVAAMSELDRVIQEEAVAYFNGACNANEAARRIQDRTTIYLAEKG